MQQSTLRLKAALSPLYDPREVRAIVRLLIEEVCGMTYTEMIMRQDETLPEEQSRLLAHYAEKLSQGIPVQQVLGYTWVRGRRFAVSPEVLIPRPETEELIDMVVKETMDKPVHNRVDNPMENPREKGMEKGVDKGMEKGVDNPVYNLLDIGTGSGCIALSLAADIHPSFVTAVDLSTGALTIAKGNAKSLDITNIRFINADILREENEDFCTELSTIEYDVIVSNPPYICNREATEMEENVLKHEPHMALFVPDEDPLLFYRVIARYGMRHLRPCGRLYFEINATFGNETCQLLSDLGYREVTLHQDFTGRDRFVSAVSPKG